MKKCVEPDIVILGGGIAGLWLLNRLRQLNYSAILLEAKSLGGGQTNKSQGIIHGGMKYALQGILTSATQAISNMPTVWETCLSGKGEINLSNVPVLSKHQYLWSNGSLSSRLAGFFASMTLKSHLVQLSRDEFPSIFKTPAFNGQVYALAEMVLDIPRVVKELAKPHEDVIFKIDALQEGQLQFDEKGSVAYLEIQAEPIQPLQVKAKKYIFMAGAGNQALLEPLAKQGILMQRRPLHMVLVKVPFDYAVYAHCLGLTATPRVTITTHQSHDGKSVWYLGGQLAEEGVKRDASAQIAYARAELTELFPWLDFSQAEFASFFIDRAEALQADGKRPDSCYVKEVGNVLAAWPTKLALAPKLAAEVIAILQQENIQPESADLHYLRAWPVPPLAEPVWDELL